MTEYNNLCPRHSGLEERVKGNEADMVEVKENAREAHTVATAIALKVGVIEADIIELKLDLKNTCNKLDKLILTLYTSSVVLLTAIIANLIVMIRFNGGW